MMKTWVICGILIAVTSLFRVDGNDEPQKRYLAAMAKNGRLPQVSNLKKKDSNEELPAAKAGSYYDDEIPEDVGYPIYSPEEKKAVRQFFRSREYPDSGSFIGSLNEADSPVTSLEVKRNVASLARLGRLNAIRYSRFNSRLVGNKRVSSEDVNPEKESNDEGNEIEMIFDPDCHDGGQEDEEGIQESPQKKRYVAALARSGRLPIWHSQRMWGAGKRDDSRLIDDDSKFNGNHDALDNTIDETARMIPKYKRCKKVYGFESTKRNVAALAKNGKFPLSSFVNGKRNDGAASVKDPLFKNHDDGKMNVRVLARNGKIPIIHVDDKRNIAALARNGKLPFSNYQEEKRNTQDIPRNENLPFNIYAEDKRNVQAMARNGKLPFQSNAAEKRNVQAMARNGKLRFNNNLNEKRNVQAMARDGKFPFFNEKRNIQAMARNGKLLFNTYSEGKRSEEEEEDKGDFFSEDGLQSDKRNIAALARNGKLPSDMHQDMKKNLAALARNGKLPFSSYHNFKREEDDSVWEEDPSANSVEEVKRNMAALARTGKLPGRDFLEIKRNVAALARNGKLPSFNDVEKRNVAALARTGKLPTLV